MSTTLFEDKTLVCADCGQDFIWTAGEQSFFQDKGLEFAPRRCKPCKKARKERLVAKAEGLIPDQPAERVQTLITCANCGAQSYVPFVPRQGRPVYCRPCHKMLGDNNG